MGHQQLDAAGVTLFGPQPHRYGRDQKDIDPRVVGEEALQVCLAALVQRAEEEREEIDQHQEDQDEDVGQGSREVTRELAAHDYCRVSHGRFRQKIGSGLKAVIERQDLMP